MADSNEALQILECFLFEELDNNRIPHEDDWAITWEGDNFVLRHWDTGQDFHFTLTIEENEWDSEQARKDQEWD